MAYSAPTTRTTGEFITAAVWNQDVVDNIAFLANPPSCRVYHNATQSLTSNVAAFLVFNTERRDTNGMHSTSADTGRITFATAGEYIVTAHVALDARNDYEVAFAAIVKGGTQFLAVQNSRAAVVGSADLHLTVTTTDTFTVGEYVQVQVLQRNTAAAAANVRAGSATNKYSADFSAVMVGLG